MTHRRLNLVCVVGARPNFVKIAPLLHEMRRHREIAPTLVHTGQHYDARMSDSFFSELDIPPPLFNLGVGSGSHAVQTAEVMTKLEPVLDGLRPDLVLVVGDVNSTLAAALTAVKLGIPVAHVEAGLRSFDRAMPEEINRLLTDAISEYLFVTEESGRENLLREGVPPAKIQFVGNVMIDALVLFRSRWERSSIFERVRLEAGEPYAVVTLHRPANVDDPLILRDFIGAIDALANCLPIVFPAHPRVRSMLQQHVPGRPSTKEASHANGIRYVDALGYLDFVALLSRARLVLTDSGGVQEETTSLGVPCLTLRDNTERPVTITHGTNRVIGTDPTRILPEALAALARPCEALRKPPLWDGRAAARIVRALLQGHRSALPQPPPIPRDGAAADAATADSSRG